VKKNLVTRPFSAWDLLDREDGSFREVALRFEVIVFWGLLISLRTSLK
jgi:hypothetical protein